MFSKISTSAQCEVRRISGCLLDPEGSYSDMRLSMKSRMGVVRVEQRIAYLKNLIEHRVGTDELDKLAKDIVYGGRETYEYHKERRYNVNVEREVVELLGKRVAREEKELKKKKYAEKAARKKMQEGFRRQEGGQEHLVWNLNWNFERANDAESDRLRKVLKEEYVCKLGKCVERRKEETKGEKDVVLGEAAISDRELDRWVSKTG